MKLNLINEGDRRFRDLQRRASQGDHYAAMQAFNMVGRKEDKPSLSPPPISRQTKSLQDIQRDPARDPRNMPPSDRHKLISYRRMWDCVDGDREYADYRNEQTGDLISITAWGEVDFCIEEDNGAGGSDVVDHVYLGEVNVDGIWDSDYVELEFWKRVTELWARYRWEHIEKRKDEF